MMGQHKTAMCELIKVMELEEQLNDNAPRIKALTHLPQDGVA
jgi:hypothetical protein